MVLVIINVVAVPAAFSVPSNRFVVGDAVGNGEGHTRKDDHVMHPIRLAENQLLDGGC